MKGEQKNNTGLNLAGWAAVITAFGTVLTAIGFPNFFPDIIKQALSPSVESKDGSDIRFICQENRAELSTVILRTNQSEPDPIILWDVTNDYFGDEFTPKKRCQLVSERFQNIYSRDQLAYITTGIADWESDVGLPIICSVPRPGIKCIEEDLLFTLQSGDDPAQVLDEVIALRDSDSKTIMRGEDGTQPYYDIQNLIKGNKPNRF